VSRSEEEMEELVGEDGGGRISFVGSNIFIQVPTLLSLSLSLVWVSYTVAVIYFCLVGAEFSVLKYDERTGCNSARLERW
jgi:hypothetical protein